MVKCFKKLKTVANMYTQYAPSFKNMMIKGERETEGEKASMRNTEREGRKAVCKTSVLISQ